ncbi:MAG: hypothetical protein M9919_05215 [Burkholderiaceae bacterium]|nr:hypothetical protein [Burkholderiaceae bacterium]
MKIKAVAKELKNADVRFISLVKRGANRIPFRILKTDSKEGTQMIDLANLSPVLKGEKTRIVPREEKVLKAVNTRSFAQILGASVSRDIGTPPPPVKIAPAPIVSAGVILTHPVDVKLTHLGEDDGFFGAVDVDPGGSSGDTSDGPKGRRNQGDCQAAGLLAQHSAALFA